MVAFWDCLGGAVLFGLLLLCPSDPKYVESSRRQLPKNWSFVCAIYRTGKLHRRKQTNWRPYSRDVNWFTVYLSEIAIQPTALARSSVQIGDTEELDFQSNVTERDSKEIKK